VSTTGHLVKRFFIEWDPDMPPVAAAPRFCAWLRSDSIGPDQSRAIAAAVAQQAWLLLIFASEEPAHVLDAPAPR
jgi:hypothetical protein